MTSNSVSSRSERKQYQGNGNMNSTVKDVSVECDINIPIDLPDNQYLPYDDQIEEKHVQAYTKEALLNMDINHAVLEEANFKGDGKRHAIDLLSIKRDLALECKGGKRSSIQRGVGQCLFYREYDYEPYLIVSEYWEGLIDVCKSSHIPLIHCRPQNHGFDILTSDRSAASLFGKSAIF